jgi:hydroxyacylglutathione hydrolase
VSPLAFFRRAFPSANSVLLHGSRPVLVDTGFGSDADAMEVWLRAREVPPERLSLIVNTHHHSDTWAGISGCNPATAFRSPRTAAKQP